MSGDIPTETPFDDSKKGRSWSASYKVLFALALAGMLAITGVAYWQTLQIDSLEATVQTLGGDNRWQERDTLEPFDGGNMTQAELLEIVNNQRYATAGFYALEQLFCDGELGHQALYSKSQVAIDGSKLYVQTVCGDVDGDAGLFRVIYDQETGEAVLTILQPYEDKHEETQGPALP